MRAVVTRVRSASVEIGGEIKSSIGQGFLVLLGVHEDDGEAEAVKIADKICGLRVFEDENGKMNLNPEAAGCPNLLIISQFTLFADCKSRRPGFSKAATTAQRGALDWAPRFRASAALPSAPANSGRICSSNPSTTAP